MRCDSAGCGCPDSANRLPIAMDTYPQDQDERQARNGKWKETNATYPPMKALARNRYDPIQYPSQAVEETAKPSMQLTRYDL